MEPIQIYGGYPLHGEVSIQGSKNAALPILAATVLTGGVCVLENCPDIADVECMRRLLESVGCAAVRTGGRIAVDSSLIRDIHLPREYVTSMRSSVVLMGALLGRTGRVKLNYPGGCVIGERPIDLHLQALRRLGVELYEADGVLHGEAKRLHGAEITLPFPSVGATQNIILAAALAKGSTLLRGAAIEPEITALCRYLNLAGARIHIEGEGSIRIDGVDDLSPCDFRIPFDRIVAGTYLLGCMCAGGEITLNGADPGQLDAVMGVLGKMGGCCRSGKTRIQLKAPERPEAVGYVRTDVYPGYPTDLQSPLLAALSLAKGESVIEETIFENRFRVVRELRRMGSDIRIEGNRAYIRGVESLYGARVSAMELRGGAALCMAALAAEGKSAVYNRRFIDRGYENLERDLRSLGGRI